jgi:hypothetical protein
MTPRIRDQRFCIGSSSISSPGPMGLIYKASVLSELARHGIRPDAEASPELIHDYLNDLYRYEIRRLKAQLKAGLIPKNDYAAHVTRLRERYPLLSLPVRFWTEPANPS